MVSQGYSKFPFENKAVKYQVLFIMFTLKIWGNMITKFACVFCFTRGWEKRRHQAKHYRSQHGIQNNEGINEIQWDIILAGEYNVFVCWAPFNFSVIQ